MPLGDARGKQEKCDVCVRDLVFDKIARGAKQLVQLGQARYGPVKVRGKTDCIQRLYEILLCRDKVVAENIDLLRLLFAFFV